MDRWFSFWGGKIESFDETPYHTLIRELSEELSTSINFAEKDVKFIDKYTVESDNAFIFNLFGLTLNKHQFHEKW